MITLNKQSCDLVDMQVIHIPFLPENVVRSLNNLAYVIFNVIHDM